MAINLCLGKEGCSKVAVDLDVGKTREDLRKINLKQGGLDTSITVPGFGARALTGASSRQKDNTVFINMLWGNWLTSPNSTFLAFFLLSS